ncbi:hypothetical protein M5X00_29490 [Paenibacillus alvei]|nr:hypothetical protein [Paenibacillus alvei]EJW14036.1 hypothetical protein PAV_141p01420 [Paenibacillus alvei DSM 29]MCY9545302.1 hypothetical protein [Paenibacillus alvei]MCY9707611.1 hypothetical protein [Paenibacillus alvei]MCY9758354.1 hypothetical protein [Paenibacillus alvei]MEC0082877.1 hypothetical protein [Paenibacillus alvei]
MKENKNKRERKKPKYIRDAEKAREAIVYNEGFQHGYRMGLEKGKSLK